MESVNRYPILANPTDTAPKVVRAVVPYREDPPSSGCRADIRKAAAVRSCDRAAVFGVCPRLGCVEPTAGGAL